MSENVPLIVDLDGSLIKIDTLHETMLGAFKTAPTAFLNAVLQSRLSPAPLKSSLARIWRPNPSLLPVTPSVRSLVDEAAAQGRPVILATGAHETVAQSVADELGVFDAVHATTDAVNLTGRNKADRLIQTYGEGGFDYVGDSPTDAPVWRAARKAYVVSDSPATEQIARDAKSETDHVERLPTGRRSKTAAFLKAIRPHQWLKNTLIFLPLVASHQFTVENIMAGVLAFIAFSAIASSIYLINDVFDIEDDRMHPRKKRRSFAAGDLSPVSGLTASFGLLTLGFAIAAFVSWPLVGVLALYIVVTTAYTFVLKRIPIFDVITLGGLYTLRIFAGGVAMGFDVSSWMLLFSIFLFLCLAVVKRIAEVRTVELAANGKTEVRGYKLSDGDVLLNIATSSGYGAVLVFALYVSSPQVAALYERPSILFAVCPLLLLWVSRAILVAHRGDMHDDPLVFAVTDRTSILIAAGVGATLAAGALL